MDLTKFIKTKNSDSLADSDALNVLFATSEVAPSRAATRSASSA